jgi:hypothetical protein
MAVVPVLAVLAVLAVLDGELRRSHDGERGE